MCGLLDAIDSGKTTFEAESSLRRAHGNHWYDFGSRMDSKNKKASKREVLVDNALNRIDSHGSAMNGGWCYSPSLLAPVTPGGSRMAFGRSQSVQGRA
jgi:hypothetical protein